MLAEPGPSGQRLTTPRGIWPISYGSRDSSTAPRMPSPIGEVLAALVACFDSLGVRWYLFGAQAAIYHGVVRLTVLALLSVGNVSLRRYGAVSYSLNSACDLCCVLNVA